MTSCSGTRSAAELARLRDGIHSSEPRIRAFAITTAMQKFCVYE